MTKQTNDQLSISGIFYTLVFISMLMAIPSFLIGIPAYWVYHYGIDKKTAKIDLHGQMITEVISPFGSVYKPNTLFISEGRMVFQTPRVFSNESSEEVILPSKITNVRMERGFLNDVVVIDSDSSSGAKRLYFRKDDSAKMALDLISLHVPRR